MSKREAISEELLDQVAGGNLKYVWSNSQSYGYIWINDPSNPSEADKKYYFTDHDGIMAEVAENHLKYGDYGEIQRLASLGFIDLNNYVNNY